MCKFKVGDTVISDLTGEKCDVVEISYRDDKFMVWVDSLRLGVVWNYEDRFTLYKSAHTSEYTIEDIDYSGCHPVIADALKRGKKILCVYSDEEGIFGDYKTSNKRYIVGYNNNLYVTENLCRWKHAEPVPNKKKITRIKKASDIVKWLEDNEYNFHDDMWVGDDIGFNIDMIQFCGQEYTGKTEENHWNWHKEWLEEVEV